MRKPSRGRRRKPKLTIETMRTLEQLIAAVNGDVHDLVNLLAALRGQMALMKDVFRLVLDEVQRIDDKLQQVDALKPPGGT